MAVFNEPTKWQTSLVNSGDANTIPQNTPVGTGEASFEDGFPQITQIPLSAGGQAPDRKDFNGLFKVLGDSIFYMQNGGLWTYNSAYDYAVGRVVLYNDNIYKCIQANGASSTVVAPDSVSPLGSDYWVQVATLADFANFANTDLSNLSASGQALFTNKADKDFTNIDNTAKIAIIHNSMPSDVFDALTLGTSDATYTAPADGFIAVSFSVSQGGILDIKTYDNSSNVLIEERRAFPGSGSTILTSLVPIRKNQTFSINYRAVSKTQYFRFIYAVGSESEQ